MKKRKILWSTLITGLVVLVISSCSDKLYVNRAMTWAENGERLDTALKSVEHATELEETKNWPKTYYAKGYVYQKIYESEKNEFKDLTDKPLFEAFENYQKAYDMDEEDKYKGSIDAAMFKLHTYFIKEGVNSFQNSNYEDAFKNFKYSLQVSEMPIFENRVDTAIMFNAGIAAQNMKNWEDAAKYYKQAAEYGYGEARTYILLKNAYFQAGDTTKAVEALKEGFNKYPGNENMIASLINHYLLNTDHPEKALDFIQEAKNQHPENAQYYSAEAQIYDKLDQNEKAKESYKAAIERDPDLFMALYNLGVLYFNEGVDIVSKANQTKDDAEYKKLRDQANEKFKQAIPYMERALEVKPDETNVLNTLKTLYYRLRTEDPKYLEKYKEVNAKLKQLNEGSGQESENK
ncbi:MAG: tetratricopeptide repeat protein [Bacteroidales bacterium]|nr:tetratricopeptide repeat protein [Bacteroidales bacterium]